ncbi:MAG: 2-phospho-L-lactate guanylyltransferase [Candidatus Nitrosocaldus sp.]|nr:2-phospho-L-lactate guanylyltransferase [Candidatus Nitrosocaldus sp.]MDW8000631.1 2-phospho-L-lactate guanylyltransferase [Candidatus Nitrosocaldus sp.]
MRLCAVIPVKSLAKGKSRLAGLLSIEERISLSVAMLRDMLECLCSSPYIASTVIVSSDPLIKGIAREFNTILVEDDVEHGVNTAVALADYIARGYDASVVLPHDLPLIDAIDLAMLYTSTLHNARCVVITPSSRLDGTNVLLRRPPDIISTHYDEDSYILHVKEALASNARVKILLSSRLMFDVDEPEDVRALLAKNHECNTRRYLLSILDGAKKGSI